VSVTVLEANDTIGGGTRSAEKILPGLIHDECSAFHPIAAASPFLKSLQLERHGLTWLYPEVDCAHPLDDGSCGVFVRSLEQTTERLGVDGRVWRQLFGRSRSTFEGLLADTTQPILRMPRHPLALARFGTAAMLPATAVAQLMRTKEAKALWAGAAAHAFAPLHGPFTSAIGLMLLLAGHLEGWPVAKGGSHSIANALAADIRAHGGVIEIGQRVSASTLPKADIVMLDVAPATAASLLGDRLPQSVARAYQRFRHGPGAFKVDFAVEGGVPWTSEPALRAGTVHLGGELREVVTNEADIWRGVMPERPFVLVGQQYLADPLRSAGNIHPVWSYAHVPSGFTGDATHAIIAQIERFAPGFQERVVGTAVRTTTEFSVSNANFVGGDIIGGASTMRQLMFRPRFGRDPYFTGVPGVYLCSASTPPGAGAHAMCGANAAARALRELGIQPAAGK
jgi:phytoene dehydrogenase-like protein